MSDLHTFTKNRPEWKAARAAMLERDDHQCQCPGCTKHDGWCGSSDHLQADHRVPLVVLFADGPTPEAVAEACDVNNLLTLCRPCNATKGARLEVAVERHTWVNPLYVDTLGWLDSATREPEEVARVL